MQKHFIKFFAGIALFGACFFAGCSNALTERESADMTEYGSLVIGNGSRAVDVSSIKSAVVTVTGNGIEMSIKKTCTDIIDGKGSVEITNIPVGKNRIISVQAYSDDSAATLIDEAVVRAVVDIKQGVNTLDEISWTTSRKGYVYNALFEGSVNISSLSSEEENAIMTAIPDCDATNIDLENFVNDFKTGYANLKDKSSYILNSTDELKRVVVEESSDSTETAPKFSATAYFTVSGEKDVTDSADWASTDETVATVDKGAVTLVSAGETVVSASYTYGNVTKTGVRQTVKVSSVGGGLAVYVQANYDEVSGGGYIYGWKDDSKPYGSWPGTEMELTSDSAAYYYIVDASEVAYLIFNNNSKQSPNLDLPAESGHYLAYYNTTISDWDWKEYDGTRVSLPDSVLTATVTSEVIYDPTKPTVTITPASGEVSVDGTITIAYKENYATVTAATVTITGDVSKSYSLSDFTDGKLSISVKTALGIEDEGKSIVVNASATNSEGTANATPASLTTTKKAVAKDTFTWDNVNCYFVLTDRFYNGDTANDHSYYRQNADNNTTLSSGYNNVATFHGGDIKGLTEKLDYLNRLGVNAIWITAPYEQVHGWCSGGGNGFPHYAFHGYYTQDWTYMDQNMGTIEEFRTFVDEAHKRGIRVVMDVVMNHTGYNTVEDMLTYDFGNFSTTPSHGWIGSGTWKDNHTITNYSEQGKWGNWWGCWVRAFGDQSWASSAGYASVGSGDITGPLSGLPDIVTEKTESVSIPTFLKTKWNAEGDSVTVPAETGNTCGNKYGDYKLPSVSNVDWYSKSGDWRTDGKGAPADYQIVWLSGWVREFGIDGFRCDTAKHIDMYRWGQLKVACQSALEKWRADSTKADSANAKNWDESFWMTGECFGWTSIEGQGEYYTTGGFDSMIGFDIGGDNHWENSSYSYYVPSITESTWSNYLSINNNDDSDSNGNRNNVLTYISSHDTRLSRTSDQKSLGTMFTLLPGGVQIYYGDETSREKAYTDCGDGDMATRGDFNWDAENGETAVHWGKVGTFRKYNPAVGAGVGSGTKRTYSGSAGESKVAIGISGTSVDVSDLFADGTTVYNWYDGNSNTVSGGTVTFAGGTTSQPILVSDKNPADYGITF